MNIHALLTIILQVANYAGVAQLFRALPCQGRGRELESLHPHQNWTKLHRRARERLFCLGNYGFAQQNPSVFLGGELRFEHAHACFFVFQNQVRAEDFEAKRLFCFKIVRAGYFTDRNGSF